MKTYYLLLLLTLYCFSSCNQKTGDDQKSAINIVGTWQLLTHTEITKGVSAVTDYTKNQKFIKIINDTHFAFLTHNIQKDSALKFDAGGGSYSLVGDKYTEHLDFYNDRNWENKSFDFTISLKNDTLTQKGLEKNDKENINRVIIEKYVKVKN